MVDANLITAINSGTGYFTTLVKLKARPEQGGDEMRACLFDVPITFESQVYNPAPFTPSQMQNKGGVEPDGGALMALFGSDLTSLQLRGGKWGGASLELIQIDFRHPEWGALKRWRGRVGDAKDAGYQTEAQIRGLMDLLNQPTGDRTSKLCRYQLGDAKCTVNAADYTTPGTVNAPVNKQKFSAFLSFALENGLRGRYYIGDNFAHLYTSKIATQINFDWGLNAPIFGLRANDWSARWEGVITPTASGVWTFSIDTFATYNRVKLFVNNNAVPIIDKWLGGGPVPYTGTVALTNGVQAPIKLEFGDSGVYGGLATKAKCKLSWSHASVPLQLVPASALKTPGTAGADDHYFRNGRLTWVDGANAGLSMEVADNDDNTIILFQPMPGVIAAEDAFNIVAGDDKTLQVCHGKFGNAINFGGEADIPTRESIFVIPQ